MIRSVSCRNLRSLRDLRLDLGPGVNLVLGPNGAGKSTLGNAILYALSGWCEWTDARGAGYRDLITHGEDHSAIDVDTDFGAVMRTLRVTGASLAVDNRTGREAQALLDTKLPDRELLAVMLRSDGFINLTAREQQDVLFRLAGGAADADWFAAHLTEEEREVLREDLATRLTGSALAESLYKAAYAKRTEANRQVKQTTAPVCTLASSEIKQRLDNAHSALDELQQKLGAAQASAALRVKWEQTEAQRNQLRERLQSLVAIEAESDDQIAALVAEQEKLQAKCTGLLEQRAAAIAEADTLEQSVAAFEALAGNCVLGAVTCPLDANARREALNTAKAAVAEARAKADKVEAELRTAEEALAAHKDKLAEAHNRRSLAQRQAQERAAIEQQLEALGASEEPPAATDVADLTGQVRAQQEEVAKLEVAYRTAIEVEASARANVQAQARAKMLDALVKKLSPDGLPAQAMRETVGNVVAAINDALVQFTDFRLNENLDVLRGEQATPIRLLSEGEKLMVGASISVAVAKLTGFGFVVVDAADRLDTTHRGPLLMMLLRSGVQALVLATPLNGKRPHAEGLAVYDLVDGAVKRSDVVQGVAA